MAELGQTFDATVVPPSTYELIPNGTVALAQVTKSEIAPTKAGNGKILKLTWTIIDGPYENRLIFQNLNIENASTKAQSIGQSQLADVCFACGKQVVSDSDELHEIPCRITIAVKPGNAGYEPSNDIKSVKPLNQQPTAQAARPAAAAPVARAPQAPVAGQRPWNTQGRVSA